MEPDRCCLAGVDFLGAMEVDPWEQICKNNKKNEIGRRKGRKKARGGKSSTVQVFIGPKIFAASPRRRVLRSGIETFAAAYPRVDQRRRVLFRCVPGSYAEKLYVATQRHRVLRCCVPESLEQGCSILF